MSYMAEATLEFFVEDSFMNITKEQEAQIVAVLEPARESIEISMENFEPECQSWRDVRNSMWSYYDEYMPQIDAITADLDRQDD